MYSKYFYVWRIAHYLDGFEKVRFFHYRSSYEPATYVSLRVLNTTLWRFGRCKEAMDINLVIK